jgi:tyrosinase
LNKQRWNYIELDKFAVKLNAGENQIVRKSSESSVSIPDRVTTKALRKQVEEALEGKTTITVDKDYRHCGLPDRMLLPKGKENGMPFTLFVMVTDFNEDKVNDLPHDYEYGGSTSYCGTTNTKYPDSKPMGYPFDRQIPHTKDFIVSNMHFKDVEIKFDAHHTV